MRLEHEIADLQDRVLRQERELLALSEEFQKFRSAQNSVVSQISELKQNMSELRGTVIRDLRTHVSRSPTSINDCELGDKIAQLEKDFRNEQNYRHGCELIFGERGYDRSQVLGVKLLTTAADAGHSDAQYRVGKCWHSGIGVLRDVDRAWFYYKKSADQGNSWGENAYAALLEANNDFEQAAQYYARSASQGNSKGQANYGQILQSGRGIALNLEEAVNYFKLSADQDNAQGLYFYGLCLEQGTFLNRNPDRAISFYRRSADQSYPFAQVRLGFCLENGIGCPVDPERAVSFYKLAAAQNNHVGQVALARCFEAGRGIPRDTQHAVLYFRLAAEWSGEGAFEYGRCLENGKGVAQDMTSAAEY
jgi:TPR repeat protein